MDSRVCPTLANVIINVADEKDLFGTGFANPAEAHNEYDNDERVIGIITRGIGSERADPVVVERCTWMQVR
jgi:hypothetical protein